MWDTGDTQHMSTGIRNQIMKEQFVFYKIHQNQEFVSQMRTTAPDATAGSKNNEWSF